MGTHLVRRWVAVVVAAVVGMAVAVRAAAPQETIDDIVRKNLEARGGLARLRQITSIKQTGTMTMMGMPASRPVLMTIYSKRPNLVRQEMTVNGQLVVNGFDGATPWLINPFMGSTEPVIVSGPQADMIREQSAFDGPLADYRARGLTVAVEGLEASGDRTLVHLSLTSAAMPVRHLYLDATTYLDVRMTTEQDRVTLEQQFDDYRDVQGVKWPFRLRMLTNGLVQSETTLTQVEFNVKMDDAMFRVPKGS